MMAEDNKQGDIKQKEVLEPLVNSNNTYKVIIVGDAKVGKTALVSVLRGLPFPEQYKFTLGSEVHPVCFKTNVKGKTVTLTLWDLAGQETFVPVADAYFMFAHAALIMYDTNSPASFEIMSSWEKDVDRIVGNAPRVYVANKSDLKNQITNEQVEEASKRHPVIPISVKETKNILEPFKNIIRQLERNDTLEIFPMTYQKSGEKKREFSVLLCGDTSTGKTTFLSRQDGQDFQQEYFESCMVRVFELIFNTNDGDVCFHVFDIPGALLHEGQEYRCPEEQFKSITQLCDAVIFFFDTTNAETYNHIAQWYRKVENQLTHSVPMILVGNKVDVKERQVTPEQINFPNMQYYDLSSQSNYNSEKPFLHLMRTLCKNETMEILPRQAERPPQTTNATFGSGFVFGASTNTRTFGFGNSTM